MEVHNISNFMEAMDIFFIISPGHNFLYNNSPSRLLLYRITWGRKGERGYPSYFKGSNPFKEWTGLFPRFKLYDWHFISFGGSLPVPFGGLCRCSRNRRLIYRYNFDQLRQQCARSPRWSAQCLHRQAVLVANFTWSMVWILLPPWSTPPLVEAGNWKTVWSSNGQTITLAIFGLLLKNPWRLQLIPLKVPYYRWTHPLVMSEKADFQNGL